MDAWVIQKFLSDREPAIDVEHTSLIKAPIIDSLLYRLMLYVV